MKAMEWNRTSHSILDKVVAWFDLFQSIMAHSSIVSSNVYNMDETGVMLGMLKSTRVLTASDNVKKHRSAPQNRELVTAVECIAVDGFVLKPMIIMKAKSLRDAWYSHEGTTNWHFAVSKNGYTDSILTYKWLTKVFDPQTRNRAQGGSRVLISDGLMSHESVDLMTFCFKNNIILMRLPSHTSHVTQPLDVSCFGPLKAYYRNEVEKLFRGGSMGVTKRNFVWLYHNARQKAFTISNIESAWQNSGLYPFNAALVIDKERAANPSSSSGPLISSSPPFTGRTPSCAIYPAHSDSEDLLQASIKTPSTSKQLGILSANISSAVEEGVVLDTPCKNRVQKLMHAAERSFAERVCLLGLLPTDR